MTSIEKLLFIVKMIPKGKVFSYGKVADLAGLPGRARMVSRALKQATENSKTPWHRVINSQGKISLSKDSSAYRQQVELLRTEGIEVIKGKINLTRYEWKPDPATLVMNIPF